MTMQARSSDRLDLHQKFTEALITGIPPGRLITRLIDDRPVVHVGSLVGGKVKLTEVIPFLEVFAEPVDTRTWVLFPLPLSRKLYLETFDHVDPDAFEPITKWK